MPNVCILTDSTAQFTQIDFPGRERVHIIPFDPHSGARQEGTSLPRSNIPARCGLVAPSVQEFARWYERLGLRYDSILVLITSSLLNPVMQNAIQAARRSANHVAVEVIDSQTVAAGLGMLVQQAAGAAAAGAPLAEIEKQVRVSIPHIYMLFCISELVHLAHSGFISYAQALAGETLGMLPIFSIEEGRLVPVEKARTSRHLFEAFQDFMSEFDAPLQIALMRGMGGNAMRTRPLRQYVEAIFPGTPFSEHPIQPHLAVLFGPQVTGLVIMDDHSKK